MIDPHNVALWPALKSLGFGSPFISWLLWRMVIGTIRKIIAVLLIGGVLGLSGLVYYWMHSASF